MPDKNPTSDPFAFLAEASKKHTAGIRASLARKGNIRTILIHSLIDNFDILDEKALCGSEERVLDLNGKKINLRLPVYIHYPWLDVLHWREHLNRDTACVNWRPQIPTLEVDLKQRLDDFERSKTISYEVSDFRIRMYRWGLLPHRFLRELLLKAAAELYCRRTVDLSSTEVHSIEVQVVGCGKFPLEEEVCSALTQDFSDLSLVWVPSYITHESEGEIHWRPRKENLLLQHDHALLIGKRWGYSWIIHHWGEKPAEQKLVGQN